jgi:hypothetical protein
MDGRVAGRVRPCAGVFHTAFTHARRRGMCRLAADEPRADDAYLNAAKLFLRTGGSAVLPTHSCQPGMAAKHAIAEG